MSLKFQANNYDRKRNRRFYNILYVKWGKTSDISGKNEYYYNSTRGDAAKEGNKLQRPNLGVIQHTPHEAQYSS